MKGVWGKVGGRGFKEDKEDMVILSWLKIFKQWDFGKQVWCPFPLMPWQF